MGKTDPNALQTLNNPGTIDLITNRLESVLYDKWFKYHNTLCSESPSFEDFARWIEIRADIARHQNNSRQTQNNLHQA